MEVPQGLSDQGVMVNKEKCKRVKWVLSENKDERLLWRE